MRDANLAPAFSGTGKFNSNEVMEQAILASGTEMVTVAMKRIDMDNKEDDMLKHIIHPNIQLLPNTSGVRNAEEAISPHNWLTKPLEQTG